MAVAGPGPPPASPFGLEALLTGSDQAVFNVDTEALDASLLVWLICFCVSALPSSRARVSLLILSPVEGALPNTRRACLLERRPSLAEVAGAGAVV